MSDSQFHFLIRGRDAETIAQKAAAILSAELGAKATLSAPNRPYQDGSRDIDPIALAALIVSIPSAALATLDLLERMKKKQKIENALTKIEGLIADFTDASIQLKAPDGTLLKIEKSAAAKLIDAANKDDK